MASNKTPRRRAYISSDESDDEREQSKEHVVLSETDEEAADNSVVAVSDDDGEEEAVDRSVVAESDDEEEEAVDQSVVEESEEEEEEAIDQSVVDESEDEEEEANSDVVDASVVAESDGEEEESAPASPMSREASFAASTPLNPKKKATEADLNETFERMSVGGDTSRSAASRSLSNSSNEAASNDRDRSFHAKEVAESPISKRLAGQTDKHSQQALRERLLRKQAVAARDGREGRDSRDSRDSRESRDSMERSSSLLSSTLSPIAPKHIPQGYAKDGSSRRSTGSEMDTSSPKDKSASMLSEDGTAECTKRSSEMSEDSSREKEESLSPKSDKENERSPSERRVRKKLNMSELDEQKKRLDPEEEKVKKFMTPRKTRIVESDEEKEVKKEEDLFKIESSDEEMDTKKGVKKEDSIVEIIDSDEEVKKEEEEEIDDEEEEDDGPPQLKKEEQIEDDEIMLSSSSPSPTGHPSTSTAVTRPAPSLSSTSSSSSSSKTHLHPTTHKTLTNEDIATMETDLNRLLNLLGRKDMKLPDGGAALRKKIEEITSKIEAARLAQPARRVEPPAVKGRLQVIDAPTDPDAYNRLIVDEGLGKKRLIGGVMTAERMENVKRITKETLESMHKEMTSSPEGEETPTPRGMRVELMGHQKTGLTWMMWREKQKAPGGILADDMGLGKTMSMISLILQSKNDRLQLEKEDEEKFERMEAKLKKACSEKGLVASHTTLVIAPASVIYQWEKEIENRVKGNRLSVLVFHGPKNKREDRAKKLAKYDVVITTYNIITAELTEKVNITNDSDGESESDDEDEKLGKKAAVAGDKQKSRVSKKQISVLTQLHWERIILDEAHQIKNRTALISKAVTRLPGRNKWCLTGTPVHNNLLDLFSLVRFLRVHPFDELAIFKEDIINAKNGNIRLNSLVKSLLLRRLKSQVDEKTNMPLVNLKPKQYDVFEIELDGLEKAIYAMMFKAVQSKVQSFVQQQEDNKEMDMWGRVRRRKADKKEESDEVIVNPFKEGTIDVNDSSKFKAMSCVLTLLLRLRQAVVHLSLTKEALDLSAFEGLPMGTRDEMLDAELSQMSLDETGGDGEDKEGAVATTQDVQRTFSRKFLSAKVRGLLDKLDHATAAGDKCVVVSQWTSVLSIVRYHIEKREIEYTEITGEVATGDRQERVDSFNQVGGGAQVMLLSLTAGGVGLNLVGGNHLFLVDLHWNPALEAQACDRIYRMGQTKNVYIHKLLCKNTIEEAILALQNKKSALAKSVLEGASSKDLKKLTVADLRFLFDLDGEQRKKEQMEEALQRSKAQVDASNQQLANQQAAAAAGPSFRPAQLQQQQHSAAAHNYMTSVYGGAAPRPPRPTGSSSSNPPEVITL